MKNQEEVIAFIKGGKSVADIVAFLVMADVYATKTEARSCVEALIIEEGLEPPKKVTKVGALKEWFLSQENPTSVTKDQIKQKCIDLEMKGGSVTYYVNSYHLAIELAIDLNK